MERREEERKRHTTRNIQHDPPLRFSVLDRLVQKEAFAAARAASCGNGNRYHELRRVKDTRERGDALKTILESLLDEPLACSSLFIVSTVTSRMTEHGVERIRY
jgi:hypothetical protein